MSDSRHEAEVQELIWAIVDKTISKKELEHLKELLRTDESARETYLRFVKLHADIAGAVEDGAVEDGVVEPAERPKTDASHEHVPSPKALLFRESNKSSDTKK